MATGDVKMIKTTYLQRQKDLDFIQKYSHAINSAEGSKVDANSNVSNKNIATMAAEIHKEDNMYANRLAMYKKITELYNEELAEEYIRQLEEHEIYRHDETGMPIGTPYTYSAKEAILVFLNKKPILTSFENLYNLCQDIEFLVRVLEKYKLAYVDDLLLTIYQQGQRIVRTFEQISNGMQHCPY